MMDLQYQCGNIIDYLFLDGYSMPVILIIYNNDETWAGRYAAEGKNCVSICCLVLNILRQTFNIIYNKMNILSIDFYKLHPCHATNDMVISPKTLETANNRGSSGIMRLGDGYGSMLGGSKGVGGALIVSPNAILHFGSGIDFGLTFNQYSDDLAKALKNANIRKWYDLRMIDNINGNSNAMFNRGIDNKCNVITLDSCVICEMDNPCHFLVNDGANPAGYTYLLSIEHGRMDLARIGSTAVASCLVKVSDNV